MKKLLSIAPLAIALVFFASTGSIMAQEGSSISLGYAPVSQELHINPGDTYTDKVTLWNLSDSETEYKIVIRGFKQIEDYPGTAVLLSEEQEVSSTTSAANWFRIETESILVPSQYNFELNYVIEVPENAEPGEYYAQIFFYTDQEVEPTDSVVTINNIGGGPTFLVKTGDEFTESLELIEFKSLHKFYETMDVTLSTTLENTGNVHLKPRGTLVFKNMLGQELSTMEFNPAGQAIIRDTVASYITEWCSDCLLTKNGSLAVGPITAELIINYKSESPGYSPITAETTFWVFPWKFALAVLGGIIVIVWVTKIVRKPKKKDVSHGDKPVQINEKKDEEETKSKETDL